MVALSARELALHGSGEACSTSAPAPATRPPCLPSWPREVHSIERVPGARGARARRRSRRPATRPRPRARRRRHAGPARARAVRRDRRRCRRAVAAAVALRAARAARPARRPGRATASISGSSSSSGRPKGPATLPERPLPLRPARGNGRVCAASARLDTMAPWGLARLPRLASPSRAAARHPARAPDRPPRSTSRRWQCSASSFAAATRRRASSRSRRAARRDEEIAVAVRADAARGRRVLREARRLVPLPAQRRRSASTASLRRLRGSRTAAPSPSSRSSATERGGDPRRRPARRGHAGLRGLGGTLRGRGALHAQPRAHDPPRPAQLGAAREVLRRRRDRLRHQPRGLRDAAPLRPALSARGDVLVPRRGDEQLHAEPPVDVP